MAVRAGWALFHAGTTFGLVKTEAVEGWPRVTSKELEAELEEVARGQFEFAAITICCSTTRLKNKG